jgi:hypothetical protein
VTGADYRRMVTVVVASTTAAEVARLSVGLIFGLVLRRAQRRAAFIAPHVDTPAVPPL